MRGNYRATYTHEEEGRIIGTDQVIKNMTDTGALMYATSIANKRNAEKPQNWKLVSLTDEPGKESK